MLAFRRAQCVLNWNKLLYFQIGKITEAAALLMVAIFNTCQNQWKKPKRFQLNSVWHLHCRWPLEISTASSTFKSNLFRIDLRLSYFYVNSKDRKHYLKTAKPPKRLISHVYLHILSSYSSTYSICFYQNEFSRPVDLTQQDFDEVKLMRN